MDDILAVDLLAFERGDDRARRAVVDATLRSLSTGFVYVATDLSEALIDDAYAMLGEFFSLAAVDKERFVAPGAHGQTGYTGLLVETAAGRQDADWKEMLNWGPSLPEGHPLRRRYPHRYHDQVLPEAAVPGITEVLDEFARRLSGVQRRVLRVIATGVGAHEEFFDDMLVDAPTLNRAIRYPAMQDAPGGSSGEHVWAAEHGDINLITALPRATTRGLQVLVGDPDDAGGPGGRGEQRWVDATPPPGHVIVNSGIMLERLTNAVVPTGVHRVVADADQVGERLSVVQFAHPSPWTVLAPIASCCTPERPVRFAGIEAGDLLDRVLYDINLLSG